MITSKNFFQVKKDSLRYDLAMSSDEEEKSGSVSTLLAKPSLLTRHFNKQSVQKHVEQLEAAATTRKESPKVGKTSPASKDFSGLKLKIKLPPAPQPPPPPPAPEQVATPDVKEKHSGLKIKFKTSPDRPTAKEDLSPLKIKLPKPQQPSQPESLKISLPKPPPPPQSTSEGGGGQKVPKLVIKTKRLKKKKMKVKDSNGKTKADQLQSQLETLKQCKVILENLETNKSKDIVSDDNPSVSSDEVYTSLPPPIHTTDFNVNQRISEVYMLEFLYYNF